MASVSGPFGDGEGQILTRSTAGSAGETPPMTTLVGGAPVGAATLRAALARAPRLIAVDGGADAVQGAGLVPEAVIGDLDSISPAARAAFADRLHPVAEQDSTDFAKARRTFPGPAIAVGFIGARVDHFLACLSELARGGAPCILLGEEDCVCIAAADMALDLAPGTRVSLWPLGPAEGRSTGLEWPIDGIAMSPAGRVGTSNRATGRVTLSLSGAPTALILPADALDAMLAARQMGPRRPGPPSL